MAEYNPTLPKQRDGVVWSGPDDEATKKTGLIHFAYIPSNAGPNRRVSVLVMLHGFGGNERQMWEYVSGLPQNLAIITPRAPNTAKGDGSGQFSWGTNQAPLVKFIQALPELYPVDPLKVYIAGFSEGAALGSKYALSHSHIAGLAMFSGRLGMQPADKVKFPVFIAHGRGDDQIPLEEAHKAREALTKAGAKVQAKDYGGRHYTTDQAKADFVSWMRSIHTSETKAALLDEWFRLETLKAIITSPSGTYHDPATGKFTSRPAGQGPAQRDWSKWGGKPGSKRGGGEATAPAPVSKGKVQGDSEIIKMVSKPSHPLHALYTDADEVTFTGPSKAHVFKGKLKDRGSYQFTALEGGGVKVQGNAAHNRQILNQEFESAAVGLQAINDHWGNGKRSFVVSGSPEWYRKYPETRRLRD